MYGSADPVLATTDGGFLAADLGAGKITFSASRAAGESVGTYAITPAAADGPSSLLGNYEVTFNPADFTITKKAITVTADDKTKVYGSADPALTVTVPAGALESGDSLSGDLERAAGKDVGSYAITQGQPHRRRQLRPHGHPRHAHDHQEGDHREPPTTRRRCTGRLIRR